jgi:hypothetical protein
MPYRFAGGSHHGKTINVETRWTDEAGWQPVPIIRLARPDAIPIAPPRGNFALVCDAVTVIETYRYDPRFNLFRFQAEKP